MSEHKERPSSGSSPLADPQQTLRDEGTRPPATPQAAHPSRRLLTPSTNQLLANRFQIIRLIASGGMGDVYEAADLELRERVAVKTVRAEIADDAGAMENFKREIHLARKVTHPNVCRIFDFFHHATLTDATGASDEVTFLTMELLPGETLDDRLRRAGPMPAAEALPIVEQIAAALTAAHSAGVVHRDLKSRNIILVPSPRPDEPPRAVVTDFGVARRSTAGDTTGPTLSMGAGLFGTPAYMAPEQLEGGPIGAAVDIYALGVVMYEMVTGVRPFVGDTPLATALKRLKEEPASPRIHNSNLEVEWEATILRCLQRDPRNRFANAQDVVASLRKSPGAPAALGQWRGRLRWAVVAAATVGVVAAAGVRYRTLIRDVRPTDTGGSAEAPVPAAPRRSVAVLGFRNLSGRSDADWLSIALSEMLGSELSAGEQMRTIPGETVARMKVELALATADSFARDTLTRIRSHLGSDYVVVGSYVALGAPAGGRIRLDLRLQDTVRGETVVAVADEGRESELFDLVSRTGARLRDTLGAGELAASDAGGVRAALPSNPEAARLYAEGLAKLRLFDALAARDLLEKAVEADPEHALARAALAAAWSRLGYDSKATQAARRALDLAATLPREQRLLIEGRFRESVREWDRAVDVYRRLWGFFPDNLEYGLLLAAAQRAAGQVDDALATIDGLRTLSSDLAQDPRIDLAEAAAADTVADFTRMHAAAERSATKGLARGARLLVAEGRYLQGWASIRRGNPKQAIPFFHEARAIHASAGDRAGVARTLSSLATALLNQGEDAAAQTYTQQALAVQRAIGSQAGIARTLNTMGILHYNQGNLDDAAQQYREAEAVYRDIGDRNGLAGVLNNSALVLFDRGDAARAQARFEEALAIHRDIGDRRSTALALANVARVRSARGDLAGAATLYAGAARVFREIGDKRGLVMVLWNSADALRHQGDLTSARRNLEEALEIDRTTGAKGSEAETKVSLAFLEIEDGRFVEAENLALGANEVFQAKHAIASQASAQAALAVARLAAGRLKEAQAAVDRGRALCAKSPDWTVRALIEIAAARVGAASGDAPLALKNLERVIADARRRGFVTIEFEARLAQGEIEGSTANATAGRARLAALAKDAAARGFSLIARKVSTR